jgi:hypothetical protein
MLLLLNIELNSMFVAFSGVAVVANPIKNLTQFSILVALVVPA